MRRGSKPDTQGCSAGLEKGLVSKVYACHNQGEPSKNEARLFAMCAGADAADSSLAQAACCGVLADVCRSPGLVDLFRSGSVVLGP